jgi:hypothetical protein
MKKKLSIIILFFSLIALFLSAQETNDVRQTELFNFGWKFHLGDVVERRKSAV